MSNEDEQIHTEQSDEDGIQKPEEMTLRDWTMVVAAVTGPVLAQIALILHQLARTGTFVPPLPWK